MAAALIEIRSRRSTTFQRVFALFEVLTASTVVSWWGQKLSLLESKLVLLQSERRFCQTMLSLAVKRRSREGAGYFLRLSLQAKVPTSSSEKSIVAV